MPNIIGQSDRVTSSTPPMAAHVEHLRHLANPAIARSVLNESYGGPSRTKKEAAEIASHVAQALEFHEASKVATRRIRPVLQYYGFLNLSVAAILAYRPHQFERYRQHGVRDRTHGLTELSLASEVIKIGPGAVPLFHSIFSDAVIEGRKFRFGQLASGFHMVESELSMFFNRAPYTYFVHENVAQHQGKWHSHFAYYRRTPKGGNLVQERVPTSAIETAMPLLKSDYKRFDSKSINLTKYRSRQSWTTEQRAWKTHKKNGIKLINFGGHIGHGSYAWQGVSRMPLLPTLTSTMLISFTLSSIVRYRPNLLDAAMNSPMSLLLDTFVNEADQVFLPTLRNLLYRQELTIAPAGSL